MCLCLDVICITFIYAQDPLEGTDLCGSGIADSWKSCAICLEEMADSDLMVHTACGGTLCQSCLEVHEAKAVFIVATLSITLQ